MLNKQTKDQIIKKFALHENDKGSTEIQVAILTKEIEELTKHLKENKHDFSSQFGLFKKIGHRKKLLNYLKKENLDRYNKLIADLGL